MNKNRLELLKECLESVEKYTKDVKYELIIVDALSTDGSREYLLNNWSHKASLIFEKDNTSYAASNNRVMKWCYGKYIYLLNNDCVVTDKWLRNAIDFAEKDDSVGHVASLVLWPNNTIMSHGANKTNNGDTIIPFMKKNPSDANKVANYAYAGFGLYRQDVYNKTGGLPEYDTPIYFDDDGYSFSVWSLGYDVRYCPESVIIHKLYHTERTHHKDADKKGREGFMAEWGEFLKENNGFAPDYPFTGKRPYKNKKTTPMLVPIKEDIKTISQNILIFSNVEFVDGGGSKRPANLARAFLKLGYTVTFVNIYPSCESIKYYPKDVENNLNNIQFIDIKEFNVNAFLSGIGKDCILAINELPHPKVLPILQELKNQKPEIKVITEVIDHWNTSLGSSWYNKSVEKEIYNISDFVSVTAKPLADIVKQHTDKNIIYSPNAVNIDIFNKNLEYEYPKDMPKGKPIVLYMGALWGNWIDYDLLEEAISKYQKYNFVFIGDAVCNLKSKWSKYSNCFVLGLKPVLSLPAYLKYTDLCLIPFKFNDTTDIVKYVSPLKLFEYLAMGKKVLSTYYEEISDIPYLHLVKSKEEFISSISKVIKCQDYDCSVFINNNTWIKRAEQLLNPTNVIPLVTIVLPTYNHGKFLDRAITSILNQTYKNIELIIVDDGSTDNTSEILDKYKDYSNIQIIKHNRNQNLPKALNTGFDKATGKFYTWTSADNCLLPNQIETLVKYLQDNPSKGMVYSNYYFIDCDGNLLYNGNTRLHNRNPENTCMTKLPTEITRENLYLSRDNFIGASFMYRADVAKDIGNYDVTVFGAEDYDYWLRIGNKFEIGHCPEVLYRYRVHKDTLNARAAELNIQGNVVRVLQKNKNFMLKEINYDKLLSLVDNTKIKVIFHLDKFHAGGLEKVLYSLVKTIDKSIFDPIVFVENNIPSYFGDKLLKDGYKVFCLDKNLDVMKTLLDKIKPHIVNIHYSWFGLDEYKNRKIKIVYTIHNNYIWFNQQARKYRVAVYRDYMDSFIAVSNCVRDYFLHYFYNNGNKVITIPNGNFKETSSYTQNYSRGLLKIDDKDFVFINTATFSKIKCQDLIIESCRQFKDTNVKCILAGGNSTDPRFYNDCINSIKQYKLNNNIVVLPNIQPENVDVLYKLSDCFILPSITEGWSMSVMEAIENKLPLILSNTGSAKELVTNNGIVMQNIRNNNSICGDNLYTTLNHTSKSITNCKNAMLEMVNKYSTYKQAAENNSKLLLDRYSMENQIRSYEREFKKVLNI